MQYLCSQRYNLMYCIKYIYITAYKEYQLKAIEDYISNSSRQYKAW